MAFEPKKFNDLYEAMRNRTAALTDFEVGSVARTMYESFAYELGLLYQKMNLVYLSAFVESAEGTHLDQVVATLGIQRSLPDYAVGEVVFFARQRQCDINIPAGTLVATEDTPELPKKVYQTIEASILAKDQLQVTVKVQAINRGEEQDSDPESIVVMPRPIPGIKSVNNPQPVILVGRRRETDDELRHRAKNALLSSGKANLAALENAVLSLPGVLDVKVREDFHFAKGFITLTRAGGGIAATVPKGSTISAGASPPVRPYRLIRDVVFAAGETTKGTQIASLLEGKQGELAPGETLTFDSSALAAAYTLGYTDKIVQSQFGMAEVIVDTPDFNTIKPKVIEAVDAVRAAGVFVSVTGAQKVNVDGVFRIEAAAQLNLSPDERIAFEGKVRQEIARFFQGIKMGQPVLFSKMMKAVLSVDGVEDLTEFRITTLVPGTINPREFLLKDNKIEADELERFYPKHLCVASEDKLLPVNITFKASSLDTSKTASIKTALESYLNGISLEGVILRSEIQTKIVNVAGVTTDLKIRPVSWCPNPDSVPDDSVGSYTTTFVEKPVLGNLFGYKQEVQVGGALLLVLPNNVKESDKGSIRTKARENIAAYLDSLAPEDDIIIDTLLSEVKKDRMVLDTKFNEDDLIVSIMSTTVVNDPNRFKDGKIDVKAFEKAVLGSSAFVIATEVTNVEITVTAITIVITQPEDLAHPVNVAALTPAIKAQMAHTVEIFLAGYVPGQDLAYKDLKGAISNLSLGVSFTLMQLAFNAVSIAGFEVQSANAATPKDIRVREIELAVMKPLSLANITVS